MQTHPQLPNACKVLFSFKLYVIQIIWIFVDWILILIPVIYFALFVVILFTFKYIQL